MLRYPSLLVLLILLSALAYARDQQSYQSGKLMQMESVPCGAGEKNTSSAVGVTAADSGHNGDKKTPLCHEYVLQSDKVIYRIQPRDPKHSALLPVGNEAQFRVEKQNLLLRVPEGNSREREYVVISVEQRSDSTPTLTPIKLNHLQ